MLGHRFLLLKFGNDIYYENNFEFEFKLYYPDKKA